MNEKMRSCVMGLILGQFSSPLPMAQKEPVAYLYNGVRLPKLPEWDREKYPYAVILQRTNQITYGSEFVLLASPSPITYTPAIVGNALSFERIIFHAEHAIRFDIIDASTECLWTQGGSVDGVYVISNGGGTVHHYKVLWASHDVLYTDSTEVYLASSEPIPVYE